MIKKITQLQPEEAQEVLNDFMEVYLDKGFGVMNKTEIETLMYHVFRQHKLLSGVCFDDSLALRIPETKARKLIYESQVKYDYRTKDSLDSYLRTSIGDLLTHAFISKNGKEIKFAIEDKYLRVALNAKLRSNNYFADTSFNKDIVSLDENAFSELILLLVPNFKNEDVLKNLSDLQLDDSVKNKGTREFLKELFMQILVTGSMEILKVLAKMLISI